jgi:Hemerythrin HHE cation binding domain
MDITQLILDDHHEQRRRFAILEQIDSADVRSIGEIWERLSVFLEVHAAAEEEIFYPELVKLAMGPQPVVRAEPETIDAIHDHNEIRDAIAAVRGHRVGSDQWRDAVAEVNRANGDHMAEEEREGLTDFRGQVSLEERHSLGVTFAAFEARNFAGVRPVDKDPESYVHQQEAVARAREAPGSLGIGGLKGGVRPR